MPKKRKIALEEKIKDNQLVLPTGKVITFNDEQYDGIKKIRHWLQNGQTMFTLAGFAGTGKAQPLYSKLYTPNGYVTMGDVKVGDFVIGSNGNPIKVLGVFPQGIKPMYRVSFSDGFYVDCCEDHLWKVRTYKNRNCQRSYRNKYKKEREYYEILSTKQMLNNIIYTRNDKIKTTQYNYKIDVNSAAQFYKKKLPIDPYLLGVLIGDGGLTGNGIKFTSIDDEIINKVSKIVKSCYNDLSVKRISKTITFGITGNKGRKNQLYQEIKNLNLNVRSENKHIPEIFKYSSIEDRIAILQGLMDTDGTVSKKGHYITYGTVSHKLAKDISELIQSLGCVATIHYKKNNYQGCYNITLNQSNEFNVFSLTRKQNLVVKKTRYKTHRYISDIKYIEDVEQKCILVDSEDHLYLTDNFTVTHNTTIVKKILDEYKGDVVVSAPTHKAKKVIMNTTDVPGKTLHSLLGLRPDVDLDSFNPNDPQFSPIADPTIGEYDLVIIDEASMINLELYNMILDITKGYPIKILFMGDPAQLPPVGEKESAVFNQTTNEFHQLTIIERQNESNPLSAVYSSLRNNLNKESGGFERKSVMNKQGEGVIFTEDRNLFKKLIIEKYRSEEFKIDTDFAKVIAWKNATVKGANKSIRNELFGKNSDIIEVGDILMGYRSVRSSNARYNIIENSEDYRVVDKMELSMNKYGINGYQVRLREDLAHGKFKFKEVFIVNVKDHNNLHHYAKLHDEYKEIGMKREELGSWAKYYDFRRNNILMKTINKFKTGMVRSKKEIIVKDMDYGMAITTHKCQGSTYSHVFVMENDMDENWRVKERNQLKYTSLTRPTTSAVVLINGD